MDKSKLFIFYVMRNMLQRTAKNIGFSSLADLFSLDKLSHRNFRNMWWEHNSTSPLRHNNDHNASSCVNAKQLLLFEIVWFRNYENKSSRQVKFRESICFVVHFTFYESLINAMYNCCTMQMEHIPSGQHFQR